MWALGGGRVQFCIFSENQKPVACMKKWKEFKRQKIRAKIEQKSNKISAEFDKNYVRSTLRNVKIMRDVTLQSVLKRVRIL